MFEKDLRIVFLLDFYGDVLDDHTKNILMLYYDDDLSLAEIAEDEGISRQGVRHIIKKGENQLLFFEERLGLAERFTQIKEIATSLDLTADKLLGASADKKEISETIKKLSKDIIAK